MRGRFYLLSPFGAALALICFFLPWGRVGCLGMHFSRSGAQLGGPLWLTFAAAAIILAAAGVIALLTFLKANTGRPRRTSLARILFASAALAGLLGVLVAQIRFAAGYRTLLGRVSPDTLGVEFGLGGPGTVLGLLIALAAAAWPAADPCAPPLFRAERKKRSRRLLRAAAFLGGARRPPPQ